jgi:hypothetical protein
MHDEGSAEGRCIFCDGRIASDEPGEHVFPKWLRKFLDEGEFFIHLPGTYQESGDSPVQSWGKWREHKSKDTGPRIRTVCRSCNHHWMSDLETEASPILTPMIEGKPQGLDVNRQVLISRWASKTAMVWDQLVPADARLYDASEHHWAKDKPTPPPDTTVRVGHNTGTRAEFIEHKRVGLFWELPPDPKASVRPDAHRTVMVIGKLVIEVAVRRPPNTIRVAEGNVDIDELLMPIWPTAAPKAWPPRIGLTDASIESLHNPSEPD